jgi:ferredoxin/flavodoxin
LNAAARRLIMGISVFYFSGTGNSYTAAKEISEKVSAKLISIPSLMNMEGIHADTDTIGIVFPSYIAPIAGVPLIVERFVKRLENIKQLRIFAVCTCGGYECVNALPSLLKLKRIIKGCGGKLPAMFSLRLPMNNLDYDHIPVPINRDHGIIIRRGDRKVSVISGRILKGRGTKCGLFKMLFFILMKPLYRLMREPILRDLRKKAKVPGDSTLTYRELMMLTDRSITVDDRCIGCGKCARVCPAANIKMINSRPEFQHRCEMCFACDEWCPQGAIAHWSRAKGIKYHNPKVNSPTYL